MIVALACQAKQGADRATSSFTDCGAHLWPRLIVAVVAPAGVQGDSVTLVRVQARLADGSVLDGVAQGCPAIAGVTCSFSFFTAPRDRSVTLLVQRKDMITAAAERQIPLGRFSYGPREMTYVVVTLQASGPPQVGTPRRINPCDRPYGATGSRS